MATTINIPTPLRGFTENQSAVTVESATVGDALSQLVTRFPELKRHLYTDEGTLRSFVSIFKNDEDIRHLKGPETAVEGSDEISIVPSIAGGA